MNLHVLHNGGSGSFDVVNIRADGTLEYLSEDYMDPKHAQAFIVGWHAAGEYAAPEPSIARESRRNGEGWRSVDTSRTR